MSDSDKNQWAFQNLEAVHQDTRDFFADNPDRILYLRQSFMEEDALFDRQERVGEIWALVLQIGPRCFLTRYLTDPAGMWDSGFDMDDDLVLAVMWERQDELCIQRGLLPSPYTLADLIVRKSVRMVYLRSLQ
ncbi:hypothetical protein GIY56_06490 [Paracoccus sp. YIM 132242]|uniref:Uncharacterized protein n=1 Tax=Paracoccus lichenicola TaxID=2665644 RepID=A0A6L6HRM6_9RHOB|nr:hypothetical protein [Paracoccus lichenicola]MTD99927.1 hypothetical protein [Paracoccus lichenicola]